jgi:hypothetical protein
MSQSCDNRRSQQGAHATKVVGLGRRSFSANFGSFYRGGIESDEHAAILPREDSYTDAGDVCSEFPSRRTP